MTAPPRLPGFDRTLAFLGDPYRFVSTHCRGLGTDVFETRLMLRRVVCVTGEEAAEAFYHPNRFTRRGALPPTALMLLQDKGSALMLDGGAHLHRKHMLLSLLRPARLADLAHEFIEAWEARAAAWERMPHVVLADEAPHILTRAVCAWAGVPLFEAEAAERTRELVSMYEGAGAVGPRSWRGMLLRAQTERWARGIISDVRAGRRSVAQNTAVHVIAMHRELDGTPMLLKDAAVELVNVLRPTVAIERLITF